MKLWRASKMEKNVIRKLVLEEIDDLSDERFVFVEYLETHQKAVGTGNHFSITDVIGALVRMRYDVTAIQSKFIGNRTFEVGTDVYHFTFKNGFHADRNGTLNKKVKDVEVVIPKNVKENNPSNEILETLELQLDRIASNFKQKLEAKSYKIIQKTNFVKAVGVITAVTLNSTALAYYTQEQQVLQNQKVCEMVKQIKIMPFSEMRQMYDLENWMLEQAEDHKKTR